VEWLAAEDTRGKPKVSGLRLVHRRNTGARSPGPYGCRYNPRDEFRKNRAIVEGLALDRFAGPDGLMLLLSMIAERELPPQELTVLAPPQSAAYYPSVKVAHVVSKFDRKTLEFMAEAVRDGKLVIPISQKLPLSEAAEAQATAEKGGTGKSLLVA